MELRHELKFRLPVAEAQALRQRLKTVMAYDPFNEKTQGIYEIYSLYFDTPHEKALREKQSGIADREKFRLRYYGDRDSVIHLEKKFKQEGLTGKIQGSMTKAECLSLLKGPGHDGFLLESPFPVLRELYVKMRTQMLMPKTVVAYTRQAFVFPPGNIRVTFDYNVRTHARSVDFLNRGLYWQDPNEAGFTLLEVKYDRFLPSLIRDIIQCGVRETSYSKFEACHLYD